jgi:phytoene dehydrogenase-like protein
MSFDHIVIGAGHNGLTCAAYLAKAGGKVLVLEARGQAGGAAITEEITPGFRTSSVAHLLYQLHPKVLADLALAKHGLDFAAKNIATSILGDDGAVLHMQGTTVRGSIPARDAEAWPRFWQRLSKIAKHLQPMLLMAPPRLAGRDLQQNFDLLRLGWSIRSLGKVDMREFLRIAAMNVYDLAADYFESPLIKARIAADAVLGTNLGPRSPGTVLSLLDRLTGAIDGVQGALALPKGGMGAVTTALANAAVAHGAEIQLNARVQRIIIENGKAVGVALENGEVINARNVISNAGPAATMQGMVGPRHIDAGFQRDIAKIRSKGAAAKLNLALDKLPSFTGLAGPDLAGRILLGGTVEEIERAFDASKYGGWSSTPMMEIVIPSVTDPSLAPAGQHVLSAIVQYAPYKVTGGWETRREAFLQDAIARLETFAPGITASIIAQDLKTPADLETQFGLPGGHWHHGELAIDQLLMLRPVAGAARYAMPVDNVFLCGAGCHPGGGVMGAAGYNAARAVLSKKQAA